MSTSEVVIIVLAVVIVLGAVLVAVRRVGRAQPLTESDRFTRARELTSRWSESPDTSPLHVQEAPQDADALKTAE